MALFMIQRHELSQRRACGLVSVSRTVMHYAPRSSALNDRLRKRLKELAEKHRRYGHIRLYVLLRREGSWSTTSGRSACIGPRGYP